MFDVGRVGPSVVQYLYMSLGFFETVRPYEEAARFLGKPVERAVKVRRPWPCWSLQPIRSINF